MGGRWRDEVLRDLRDLAFYWQGYGPEPRQTRGHGVVDAARRVNAGFLEEILGELLELRKAAGLIDGIAPRQRDRRGEG